MSIRILNFRILAAAFLFLLSVSPALAEEEGKITILSPKDGAEVSVDKPVMVSFEAVWGPKGNHLHLYLDDHRVDVIETADWVIDLGPEGGDGGGRIIAQGSPKDIAENPASVTGVYLKQVLQKK